MQYCKQTLGQLRFLRTARLFLQQLFVWSLAYWLRKKMDAGPEILATLQSGIRASVWTVPNKGKIDKTSAGASGLPTKGIRAHADGGISGTVQGAPATRLRRLFPIAWSIIRPYWTSEDRWAAWGLLLMVVALSLGIVYINVLSNRWSNDFYTALQEKDQSVFVQQLIRICWLVALYILVAGYQLYLNQMLQIRWRRWLTERYLRGWLAGGAYYRMQLLRSEADNPDQRIAEDVRLLISGGLDLLVGALRTLVNLIVFVAILWGLSGGLIVPVGSVSIELPGYMVWVALVYAFAGTWMTHWIGRPLVRLNFDRQRCEADFRFRLVRFRENTEGVALYRGENSEFRGFREGFGAVVGNWWQIMRRQKRLTYFTSGYGQAAWIFPSVLAAPRFFRGELTLGGLMQTIGAFGQVQESLSFFVQSYAQIAEWCAVVERLSGFDEALERVRLDPAGSGVQLAGGNETKITLKNLDLDLPDGRPLIGNVNLSIFAGDTVLLAGSSGSGKSTLLRAIAGIWPFGKGQIFSAPDARFLFLPQKPYLPVGTLREVVSYPMSANEADDAILCEALAAVGLPELPPRLGESAHWASQLSPGEQQRIAFARALVQKPQWLFLDEATSAVDEASEVRLYTLLRERLAGAAIFSIGHRATLRQFHARRLLVQRNGNGTASIIEVTPVAMPRIYGSVLTSHRPAALAS